MSDTTAIDERALPPIDGRFAVSTDRLFGLEHVLLDHAILDRAAPSGPVLEPRIGPGDRRGGREGSEEAADPDRSRRGFDPALFDGSSRVGSESASGRPRPSAAPVPRGDAQADAQTNAQTNAQNWADGTAPVQPIVDRIDPGSSGGQSERLAALAARHAAECPHCTASTTHRNLVFGEGNPDADLVFVGEAPGENEDESGRPFVGRAGAKLDEMISAMGLRREDVYIANVLKSRPSDNRTPLAHEVDRCGPYLLAQIAVIRPKVIVTLGGPAAKLLLATDLGITRLRGVVRSVEFGAAGGSPFEVPVMPTFHPAYLLRNYTTETRRQVWEDLKKVLELLGRPVPTRG